MGISPYASLFTAELEVQLMNAVKELVNSAFPPDSNAFSAISFTLESAEYGSKLFNVSVIAVPKTGDGSLS